MTLNASGRGRIILQLCGTRQGEQSRGAIVRRLEREGWVNEGGAKHDSFSHPDHARSIIVPRHRALSVGVARAIAKGAGWI